MIFTCHDNHCHTNLDPGDKYLCAERQSDVWSLCHAGTRSPCVLFHEEGDHFAGMTLQRQNSVLSAHSAGPGSLVKSSLAWNQNGLVTGRGTSHLTLTTLMSRDPQHFYPQAHLLQLQIRHCTYGIQRQRTQRRAIDNGLDILRAGS